MTPRCSKTNAPRRCAFAIAALLALYGLSAANAAPTISQGFYQEDGLTNCPNAITCDVKYSAIPASKTLIMQHASCTLQIGGNQPLAEPFGALGGQQCAKESEFPDGHAGRQHDSRRLSGSFT